MLQQNLQSESGEVASVPRSNTTTSIDYLCRHCILTCPENRGKQHTAGRWDIAAYQSLHITAPKTDFSNDSTACPSDRAEDDSEIADSKLGSCAANNFVTVRLADCLDLEGCSSAKF